MNKDTRDKIIVVIAATILLCGIKASIDILPLWIVEFMREVIVNF